jgi:hypothetical protein
MDIPWKWIKSIGTAGAMTAPTALPVAKLTSRHAYPDATPATAPLSMPAAPVVAFW